MFLKYLVYITLLVMPLSGFALESASFGKIKIDYSKVPDAPTPCLKVKAQFQASKEGRLTLRFPKWVKQVSVNTDDGQLQVNPGENSTHKHLLTNPEAIVSTEYQVCIYNPHETLEAPITRNEFFYAIGEGFLVFPEQEAKKEWQIDLKFSVPDEKFKIYSSLNSDTQHFQFKGDLEKLKLTQFVGGSNVQHEKLPNHSVYVIRDKDFKSLKDPLWDINQLIDKFEETWKQSFYKDYLVVLLEGVQGIQNTTKGKYLHNGNVLQFPHDREHPLRRYYWLMAHELEHHQTAPFAFMPSESKRGDVIWFLEGFNDYLALKHLHESGLITLDEYVDQTNEFLSGYYTLPIHSSSIDKISEGYEKDGYYHQMNQLRGHLMAHFLDKKETSAQKQQVEGLVEKIKQDFNDYHAILTHDEIKRYFQDSLNSDDYKVLEACIEQGKKIPLHPHAFGVDYELVNEKVSTPKLGFSFMDLIQHQTIKGLDKNSPAYQAGLREGQKVQYYEISLSRDYSGPMSVWVWDEKIEKPKPISFIPERGSLEVPQYTKKL